MTDFTETRMQAIIDMLAKQRNDALDKVAMQAADIAELHAALKEARVAPVVVKRGKRGG